MSFGCPRFGWYVGKTLLLPGRPLAGVAVRFLLAIELLQNRQPLLRCRGHEGGAVRPLALLVDLPHAVAENLLVARVVGVGDHERHERTGLRRLRTGRLRLGEDRLRDLVEEGDVLGGERPDARTRRDGRTLPLARSEQRAATDERD